MRLTLARRFLGALTVIAYVATLGSTLMLYAQDRLFDASSFSTTLTAALADPDVNAYLADEISTALIDEVPDLGVGGPLLAEVTGAVLESDFAARTVEVAAAEAHRTLFSGEQDSVLLDVSDLVISIEQALRSLSPELADSVPSEISELTIRLSSGEFAAGTVRLAEQMRLVTIVLTVGAAVSLIALVSLESNLFRGLARLGVILGVAGVTLVVLQGSGALVAASYGETDAQQLALAGIWASAFGDLRTWGWVLIVTGGLVGGAGWSSTRSGDAIEAIRSLGQRVQRGGKRWALVRGLAALVVALWALADPQTLMLAAVRVVGFGVAVVAVAHLLDVTGIAEWARRRLPADEDVIHPAAMARRAILPVGLIVALGIVGSAVLARDDGASALAHPEACNDHVELCDRRLDEITMAGSHNAMSSTATGFYLPNNLTTMRAQLDLGVRAFMIDTVYGRPTHDGLVLTSFADEVEDVASLDDQARAAADAARARRNEDLGDESAYLCHGYCEIGALDPVDELSVIRDWLDANPREVLVFIVQDATSPSDTAAMFTEAGFGDLVHTQALGDPFPTLREMISSDRRVFVMVEHDPGSFAWLHPAFEFTQETPFSFGSVDEFSCVPNRGQADSPLFVINHFITLARPSNQWINEFDVLHERVERCTLERGRRANIIAVDFVSKGDVMAVVDTLNGVARD